MARMSQQKFLAQLQSGKLIPAILLLGDEPYLRDACRAELIEKFVPEGSRMWGVSRFSADRGEMEQALALPKCCRCSRSNKSSSSKTSRRIEKLGEKNREATVDAISAYLENPAPFTALVLEAKSLDQRMKLGKLLLDRALVVEVGLGDDPEARLATATTLGGNVRARRRRQVGERRRRGFRRICQRRFDAPAHRNSQAGDLCRASENRFAAKMSARW